MINRLPVLAVTAMTTLIFAPEVSAQTTCATPYGTCLLAGTAVPGMGCYCVTPTGPIDGTVAGANYAQTYNPFPQFCCTPLGKMGPFTNNSILPGQYCHAAMPNGVPVVGQACF